MLRAIRCLRLRTSSSYRVFSTQTSGSLLDTGFGQHSAAPKARFPTHGRLWSDPWDLQMIVDAKESYETLPDWHPSMVSKISLDRIKIEPILTLDQLAALPLPPPPVLLPYQNAKRYANYRKSKQAQAVAEQVRKLAAPRVHDIRMLKDWNAKQEAVDQLYETLENKLRDQMVILGKHPLFGTWVEQGLEAYLQEIQDKSNETLNESTTSDSVAPATSSSSVSKTKDPWDDDDDDEDFMNMDDTKKVSVTEEHAIPSFETKDRSTEDVTPQGASSVDKDAIPIFMDLYDAIVDSPEKDAPSIVYPAAPDKRCTVGNMIEEFQLAAHKETKRIMLRQSTREIARAITNGCQRIFVHGKQGVGKTAACMAIVASARKSGAIVLYLPDGDALSSAGFYIEPSVVRKGVYDLPKIAKQICAEMLTAHAKDMGGIIVDKSTIEKYFNADQIERMNEKLNVLNEDGSISVTDLFAVGADKTSLASGSYSACLEALMSQDTTSFIMVLDGFNCYFEPGHYFHGDYDPKVKKHIPYEKISIFKQAMEALAIYSVNNEDIGEEGKLHAPAVIKRGAVIAATTEGHAIPRRVTDKLTWFAKFHESLSDEFDADKVAEYRMSIEEDHVSIPIKVIEVHRLSHIEVDHMLANYEAIGLGKLRMDRGATVEDEQEVAYLRTISGAIPQKLLDASILSCI